MLQKTKKRGKFTESPLLINVLWMLWIYCCICFSHYGAMDKEMAITQALPTDASHIFE